MYAREIENDNNLEHSFLKYYFYIGTVLCRGIHYYNVFCKYNTSGDVGCL